MSKKPLSVSHSVNIPPIATELGVVVSLAQWDLLISRIELCSDPPSFLPSLAWTCVGIAASTLVVAATLPLSVELKTAGGANYGAVVTECCLIFGGIAALGIGAAAFYFSWLWRKNRIDVRGIILGDMSAIRSRFTAPPAPSNPSP